MRSYAWTIFLFLFCAPVLAQEDLKVIKPVAPATYPPAARAVRASGDVGVSVEIDQKGKVVSARAYVGHPLLRAISESTARQWEFSEVPEGFPVRTMILFFLYEQGGSRSVEESEEYEEPVISSFFPTMFSAQISNDILIPKLLLLPREKGVTRSKNCTLHDQPMLVEIQRATCSDENSRPAFARSPDYNVAEEQEFANANSEEDRGCWTNGIERVEAHYCQACRIARSNWIQINR